jgi:dipeptidyl aminopeptidase/acylaminoacyl peptidase
MNKLLSTILLLLIFSGLSAQKPAIDTSVFDHWPRVGSPGISPDGHYAYYMLEDGYKPSVLVIRSLQGDWKKEVPEAGSAVFTGDGRKVIYKEKGDSLCLLTLGGMSAERIKSVGAFQLFTRAGAEWLACQLTNTTKDLILRDLKTGRTKTYTGVTGYWLGSGGSALVLMSESGEGDKLRQSLTWVNIESEKRQPIWEGTQLGDMVLDAKHPQLAFGVEKKKGSATEKTCWYYKEGMAAAALLADDHTPGIDAGLHLDGIGNFSQDGGRVFIKLKENDYPVAGTDAVKVDLWSYTDRELQSVQLKNLEVGPWGDGGPRKFLAVVGMADHRVIRLQQESEYIGIEDGKADDYGFVDTGSFEERNWNAANKRGFFLVDTRTGKRREVGMPEAGFAAAPSGKYIILSDLERKNFYCYTVATGVSTNITKDLPVPMVDEEYDDGGEAKPRDLWMAAWMEGEKAVIIKDMYDDLWKLDITGATPPLSLTNGYARRKKIRFRISGGFDYRLKTVADNESLVLCAFNENNKDNGFYRIVVGRQKDPELLTMGPYVYSMPEYPRGLPDFAPMKARRANVWLVSRESAAESPNYFWTSDFKTYKPVTALYPEKKFNWIHSDTMTYTTVDGRTEIGALYKPEDFDPAKKYPVIIHYYERLAHRKNVYDHPEASYGDVNIFWFVSHGYLVCTPDIHYKIGYTGESAFNSIVGCAQHLAAMPWVDGKRMGIQGGSFGGYETNYVVTHTDLFAAAAVRAGPADLISGCGSLWGGGGANHTFYEIDQIRLGASLWEKPELYIKGSPIFHADRVTTPVLLMHNKKDGAVPFSQGIEFFTALRRLGKKAWLLVYDDEDHVIIKPKAQLDFTVRMTQFFDHYLKSAPAPVWMTKGIPAKMKGIDTGLEYDKETATPGPGLLMEQAKP